MPYTIFSIIVIYNGMQKNWVRKCFSSVQDSSIPIKIIAIDNASTDNSVDYIKENFPQVILIESNKNLGFGGANNIGIKKAIDQNADYVFLLNQDAWVEPDTIQKLVEVAEQNPEYGIVSPMHLNGKGDALDLSFSEYISPKLCKDLYSDCYLKNYTRNIYTSSFVNAAAWLISRKCIETVGGFSPIFFHYGEDKNYVHRVSYHKLKLGVCPHTAIYHDRKDKSENIYFDDFKIKSERRKKMKYADPNISLPIPNVKLEFIKAVIKSILLLRFSSVKALMDTYKEEMNFPYDEINKYKELSKKVGKTFLE